MAVSSILDLYGRPIEIPEPSERQDNWRNLSTGIGVPGVDKSIASFYSETWRIMDQELRSLNDGSDLAAKVVWDRPDELFREGYDLTGRIPKPKKSGTPTDAATDVSETDIKNLREYATENFEIDSLMHESSGWGRLFGGCLDIMGIDDGGFPWEPVNEDRIRSFDYISLVDRRYAYVQSQYSGINAKKYGTAQIYLISNAIAGSGWNDHGDVRATTPQELQSGGAQIQLVHSSRVIRFDGNPADVQSRQRLAGWSWSVLQRVYNTFRQFEHAFDSAVYLLSDASQGVLKMVGLMKAIAACNRQAIQDRAMAMEMTRSVIRGLVLDAGNKDGSGAESYEREPTPLGGIADILEQMKSRFAAAAKEPQTKLFGRSPAGMNATGDADIRTWYDDVRSEGNVKVAPKIRKIYRYIALSKDSPIKGKKIDFNVEFRPLWSPTDGEIASANLARAQTDVALVGATIIPEEVAALTWKDEYPALDVEAIEESIEAKTTFDPHEGDPDPQPGEPGGPPLLPGGGPAPQLPPAGGAGGGGGSAGPGAPGSKDPDPNAGTGEPLSAAAPIPPIGPGPRLAKPLPGQTPSVATPSGKSGTPNPGQPTKVPPKPAAAGDAPPNKGTGATDPVEPTAGAQGTPPAEPAKPEDELPAAKGVPHVVVHPDEAPSFHPTKAAAKEHAKDLVKKSGGKAKILPAAEFLQKQASWSAKNPKHPTTGQFTGAQAPAQTQAQDRADRVAFVDSLVEFDTVAKDWRFDGSGWDLSDDQALDRLDAMTETREDAGAARAVFRQLLKCYPASCLGWVLAAHWYRQEVPLDQIDMSGRDRWTASKDGKIGKHVELIESGKSEPVILVSPPGDSKDVISDGHHRVLAYEKLGRPVDAWVAEVHTDAASAPWRTLHGAQKRGSSIGSVSVEPSIPAEVDAMPSPRIDARPPVRTEGGAFAKGEMSEEVETPHGKGHVQLRVMPSGEHVFSARGQTSVDGKLGKQSHVRIPAKDATPERLEAEADARRGVAHAHGLSSEVRAQAHALAHAMRGRADLLRSQAKSDAADAAPDQHAVICLVFDDQGRIATISRPEPPHEQSIPGGMVDPGEGPDTTAWRELYEELGISVGELKYVTQLVSPLDGRPVQVFMALGFDGEAYAAETDTTFQWLSSADLLEQSRIYRTCLEQLADLGALDPPGRPGVLHSEVPRAQRVIDPDEGGMNGSHVHGPGDKGGAAGDDTTRDGGLTAAGAGSTTTVIGKDTKSPTTVETGRALDSDKEKAERQKEALEAGEPDPAEASEVSPGPTSIALQPPAKTDDEPPKTDAKDEDAEAEDWLATTIAEGVADALEAYAKDLPEETADAGDDFDEAKHPRDPKGMFTSGGGGEASASSKGSGGEKAAPAASGGRLRSIFHSVVDKIRAAPAAIGRAALHEAKEKVHEFKSAALGVKAFLHPPPKITSDQKKDIGRVAVFAATSILASHLTPLLAIGHFVHAEAGAFAVEKLADQAIHHVFEKFARAGLRLNAAAIAQMTLDWNPDQDRDEKGRFGSGGAGGSEGAGPKVSSESAPKFTDKEIHGGIQQPTHDKAELFAAASKAHEEQLDLLNRGKGLVKDIGGTTVRRDLGEKPDLSKPGPVVQIGNLKSEDRAGAKVANDYAGDWSKVGDIVRASVAVDSPKQMADVVDRLRERGADIVRAKDRVSNPTEAGYRDVMMNVRYPSGHVGEIQVHVKSMLAAKSGEGHKLYDVARKLEPKMQSRSMSKDDWHTYDHAMREQRKIYGEAWAKASARTDAGDWDEARHPRGPDGKFGEGGGGEGGTPKAGSEAV
jgi:phage-related protein (TIGR01555 family)